MGERVTYHNSLIFLQVTKVTHIMYITNGQPGEKVTKNEREAIVNFIP
jgi:hypothetical protein